MEESTRWARARLIAVVIVVLVAAAAATMLGGGQTSQILSTVGAAVVGSAVGDRTGQSGSGVDTTTGASGSGSGGTAGSGASGGGGQVADAAIGPPTLLIVRTGTLELEVASLSSTVAEAGVVVSTRGGYTSGSTESAASSDASATVEYRIPAAAWDATLDGLRRLATTVRHQQVETREVSGEVVDLGARIANLRATEGAFQSIMARATKISDVLAVQRQLSATRGEIERLVADKAQLEGRAAYGTLTVTFHLPAPPAVVTAQKGWDPVSDVDRATGELIRIGQLATSTGIVLAIVGLPLLIAGIVGLVVAWQVYRLGRWLVRRRSTGIVAG
jgi:hypothetical protein